MTRASSAPSRNSALAVLLPTLHRWFLRHVKTTSHFIGLMQQSKAPLVDAVCSLVSRAADSLLYMTLLSFVALSVDHAIARKLVLMWSAGVYLANFMKDTLMLPRPYHIAGGAVKLQVKEGDRYGLPCAKTLSATCLPFYFIVLIQGLEVRAECLMKRMLRSQTIHYHNQTTTIHMLCSCVLYRSTCCVHRSERACCTSQFRRPCYGASWWDSVESVWESIRQQTLL